MSEASGELVGAGREYLLEKSLGRFLRERLDRDVVANRIVPGLARRFKPDYRSERHRVIVEFDGDEHYRSVRKILGDVEREAVFAEAGYRVVCVPYFVQLTRPVITDLFGGLARRITEIFLIFRTASSPTG